jgi:hypothetical protein
VRLKGPLCKVETDDASFFHGCPLRCVGCDKRRHLGTLRCRQEGASTPSAPLKIGAHVRDSSLADLVDHEGEVLEAVVTARRDKAAALKLLKRIMKKYGRPRTIVTDRLRAYSAAMKEIGAADRHEVGGRLNNRAENSHQPFRRRERAMQRFRSLKTLQKFSSVHAQVHNQFNQERHLVTRQVYKQRRSIALAEWRALAR